MKNIYQTAIDILDASNWRGIWNTYRRDIYPEILRETGCSHTTDNDVLAHPVTVLFYHKIIDLRWSKINWRLPNLYAPYDYLYVEIQSDAPREHRFRKTWNWAYEQCKLRSNENVD